jgi:hypothetical protein
MPALRLPSLPDKKHVMSSLVLAVTFALYIVAGLSVTSVEPVGTARANVPSHLPVVVPGLGTVPTPEPLQFRDVAPQEAVAINAAVPVSTLPNPAARPFAVDFATPADRLRAVECLTAAVYYEAAIEPTEGQRAVAQVVLNRVRHPAYPKSVCGVVFQGSERTTGCQFTFTCDGALFRTPSAAGWARARRVAEEAIAGQVYAPVGWATHYHTNWVVPYWSSSLVKAQVVGTHIFYRWEGGWGRPSAFRFRPSSSEPQIALMRRLTSDPASLAQAVEVPVVDPAATAAAAAAAAAANPDVTIPVPAASNLAGVLNAQTNIANRAVVRRYVPMTREAAVAATMAQTPQANSQLHWALTGLPEKPAAGAKAATDAAPAAAQPPKCLEGVRRLPAGGAAATSAEKQAC